LRAAIIVALFALAATVRPSAKPPARPLPFPASTTLRGLEWTAAPSRYPGSGSDMHGWTHGASCFRRRSGPAAEAARRRAGAPAGSRDARPRKRGYRAPPMAA
jgi:hypothetical protein